MKIHSGRLLRNIAFIACPLLGVEDRSYPSWHVKAIREEPDSGQVDACLSETDLVAHFEKYE